jgi:uncharacterized membrane protein
MQTVTTYLLYLLSILVLLVFVGHFVLIVGAVLMRIQRRVQKRNKEVKTASVVLNARLEKSKDSSRD